MDNDIAKGNNDYGKYPIIGQDIPWEAIRQECCRVKHFTSFSTFESGKVKSTSSILPYASLLVDLPKLKNVNLPPEATMPVVHKDDFLRLWQVFNEREVRPEEEVIVIYEQFYRSRFMSRLMPRLHIYIYPKGHFDQEYDPNYKPENIQTWFRYIAKYEPKNYKSHR